MLDKLFEHNYWANTLAVDFLKGLENPDPSFQRLTGHILNAEGIWLARLLGRTPDNDRFREVPVADMAARNEAHRADFRAVLATDVARFVDYKMIDGTPMRSRAEDMLLHVWSHGFHHRGQMAAKASALGLKYPDLSFIGYSRKL